ncbi:MAG: hypothetical protein JWM44_2853 [Bacilli bacterium]|nr:hypothetical protein [Bacilli bacterium]
MIKRKYLLKKDPRDSFESDAVDWKVILND